MMGSYLTPEYLRQAGKTIYKDNPSAGRYIKECARAWEYDRRALQFECATIDTWEKDELDTQRFLKTLAQIADCNSTSLLEAKEAIWMAREALAATENQGYTPGEYIDMSSEQKGHPAKSTSSPSLPPFTAVL